MQATGVRIDQALFGYREGHRLLQASRRFVPTTERSLLTLTDMSGPRMVDGFEEYFSGYPVPGEESYAFVKTWYAPEMERPGCVWSHVLILRNSDLTGITDVAKLIPLFRRPEDGDFDGYLSPVVQDWEDRWKQDPLVDAEEAEELLSALYDRADKPVVIPAVNAQRFERVVLAIWSQQWPTLRAAFRFCTGSLSARTLAGRAFDLQVVPHRLLRELQRDADAYEIALDAGSPDRRKRQVSEASWIKAGATDLIEGGGAFRDFLWKFADKSSEQRPLYSKNGDLFTFLQTFTTIPAESELPEITNRVCEAYPDSKTGLALKYGLFGPGNMRENELPFIPEESRLVELARTPHWRSFDAVQLRLRERARTLWAGDPARGKTLLVKLLEDSSNLLNDEIIGGLAESISVTAACDIARERPALLLALVMRSPEIVASEQLWKCKLPLHSYYGILDFLKTERATAVSPSSWIPLLVENRTNDLATAVVERFAVETIKVFLDRAVANGKEGPWIPEMSWRSALSLHQRDLLAFLDREDYAVSAPAMTLLAGLLDSHQQGLAGHGLRPWLELVKSGLDLVFQFPNAEASGFILSLGFQYSEEGALQLVSACFEHVHAAARDDSSDPLSYRTWRSLESEVPALGWKRNWDRCERLRQGLLERFISNSWPRVEFLRCVSRPATLRSILYSSRDVRGAEEFVRLVAEGVFGGLLNPTEPQKEVFRGCFRRNRRGELKLDL